MWITLSDNESNDNVIPETAQPEPASGQTLTVETAGQDKILTVEAGATYIFTAM